MSKQKVSVSDFTAVIVAACAQSGKPSVDFRQLQYGYLSNTKQRKNPRSDNRPRLQITTVQKGKATVEHVPIVAKYIGGAVQTHTGDVFYPDKGLKVAVKVVKMNEQNALEIGAE